MIEDKATNNIIVVSLGQLVNTNIHRSVAAFNALGVSKWQLMWHWNRPSILDMVYGTPNISTLVEQYKTGLINTNNFRNKIRSLFSHLVITDNQFDSAWNSMCALSSKGKKALDELKQLINNGIKVIIISGTNPLHIEHIEQQYGDKLPGTLHLSFQDNSLGMKLMLHSMQHLCEHYPQARVIKLDPPIPEMPVAYDWLRSPLWSMYQAHVISNRCFAATVAEAQHPSVTTVDWDNKRYKFGDIAKAIQPFASMNDKNHLSSRSMQMTPMADIASKESNISTSITKQSETYKRRNKI